MRLASRLTVLALGAGLAIGFAGPASANNTFDDGTGENNAQRCDTWYRDGHGTGNGYNHTSGNDQDAGPVTLHNHYGHYVLRSDTFAIEAVGGGYYADPAQPNDSLEQGGYVQGEVDPSLGGPVPADGDFHVNFFANGKAGACVAPANTKVGVSNNSKCTRPDGVVIGQCTTGDMIRPAMNEGDDPQH
jgi:hypothetical protein